MTEHQLTGEAGVTAEVQDFYERYPYPRPVDDLDNYRRLWSDPQRRRAEFHLFWPRRAFREDFSILVAGCGTSQAAKYALRWPAAQVTGIDFSERSIRCTEVLKTKYQLANLELKHLAVEQAGELGGTFDQIICTGVLHHLQDPSTGLSALRRLLAPDGTMHVMVYAPYGRAGIYMLREFCQRVGIQATDQGIREVIVALGSLPPNHPLCNLFRDSPDSRDEATLADALLHPQDRAYSVDQLFDFITANGLTFTRWLTQAPYSPLCGVMQRIPQLSRTALSMQQQYAAVELLRGTMARHSAILTSECGGASCQIRFDGESFLDYVPIRRSDTINVRERLPAGAAAVLINRLHSYTDLYMPIDGSQARLVESIDGRRTVGELIGKHTAPDDARNFFEQLWRMDQIVFDAHV